jgi:hypothetical protein
MACCTMRRLHLRLFASSNVVDFEAQVASRFWQPVTKSRFHRPFRSRPCAPHSNPRRLSYDSRDMKANASIAYHRKQVKQNAATSESSNGRHIRPENSFRGCNPSSFDRGSADLCCFVSVVVHFVDARSVIVVTLCPTRANVAESRCAIDERLRLVRQNARIVTVYD